MTHKRIWLVICSVFMIVNGHPANLQVTIRVKDDFGKPVAGAEAGISIFQRWKPGEGFGEDIHKQINGITDTNGLAVLKGSGLRNDISYGVHPRTGYYDGGGGEYWFRTNIAGRWHPWNPTLDIVLKLIVNPVPMHARCIKVHFPSPAKEYGYDLMAGDWVAPYGKGQVTDFVFRVTGYWKGVFDHDSTLTLSFDRPLDGIQQFVTLPPRAGSAFRSPREALADWYQSRWSWRRARKPEQLSPDQIDETQKDFNCFFRVRTVTDAEGKIKSALYGKLYEGFKFAGAISNGFLDSGPCYLNPEPNSRNMEFDPKRNLAKGLKWLEVVSEP
jgi:hypothetical protein